MPARRRRVATAVALAAACALGSVAPAGAQTSTGDYIVAVVNQELVTARELQIRMDRIREEAQRNRQPLPPPAELRRQVLDVLIDERVLVTSARDNGPKIDEAEVDRAAGNVAQQNQLTMQQLRERLRREGIDYQRFRSNLKDQILVERVREREVASRIKITDAEIDAAIEARRAQSGQATEIDLAQILVTVPDGADPAVVGERRARAEAALARVRAGEDFATVARSVSEDANRERGGALGLRPADRLPDVFVRAVASLAPGQVAPELLRTGAGFHVLKLLERRQPAAFTVPQVRARHVLLRVSPELTEASAIRRLGELKRQVESGSRTFEAIARENSEDGSAAQGGDLGWASPGTFVPEFEEAIAELRPGAIADPVVTRFGVHLIQMVDRREVTLEARQVREQTRAALREAKFDDAYLEWVRDLRRGAYVEMREPPT
jgi:peptidyl-prolyl cis-trans isomerase SurA